VEGGYNCSYARMTPCTVIIIPCTSPHITLINAYINFSICTPHAPRRSVLGPHQPTSPSTGAITSTLILAASVYIRTTCSASRYRPRSRHVS
jgi:hypothetical protein